MLTPLSALQPAEVLRAVLTFPQLPVPSAQEERLSVCSEDMAARTVSVVPFFLLPLPSRHMLRHMGCFIKKKIWHVYREKFQEVLI